ncbi:MAG: VTT domain-containing protein [Thermodesulfobacteriota bacterium]|nr:VTT domain-containing protein [Thermodesulfobacteriota bacterium]
MRANELFEEGRNCWRICRADRAAVLVDGAAYFSALADSLEKARHSIFIVGWDIDSRIRLCRDRQDEPPLGDFLNNLAKKHPDLHIYVLDWDFAMLYALDREPLPVFKLGWSTHKRLEFKMDARHPVGACHHQKLVVIDDCLAFCGGIDLTHGRWDTPQHAPHDPKRRDNGEDQPPFHDVQMMVSGAAAAALGELARRRWRRAGGGEPAGISSSTSDHWPQKIDAEFKDVAVAISRTEPSYEDETEVTEVKQMWMDAVAAARRRIYIENQYLTASEVVDALVRSLEREQGPEIVITLSRQHTGWLEEATMGVLTQRQVNRLREADRHHRLRIVYPERTDLGDEFIKVHAKVLVVDDVLVRVGSANLNNRSMGFDTECDLTLFAEDDATRSSVNRFCCRLLGEHLDMEIEEVELELRRRDSMISLIDERRGAARSLRRFDWEIDPFYERIVPDGSLVDPEKPVRLEDLADQILAGDSVAPRESRKVGLNKIRTLLALVGAALLLSAAWHWTPLGEYLDLEQLREWAGWVKQSRFAPLILMLVYIVGGLVLLPITVLIVVTILTFGPWWGGGYALLGSLLSALVTYGVGRWVGRDAVRQFSGARLNKISKRLAQSGMLAVMAVRLLPVAPFTVVNLVAGASHIRFVDFLFGTLAGMGPGIITLAVFEKGLEQLIRNPDLKTVMIFLGVVLGAGGLFWGMRKLIGRKMDHNLEGKAGS